MKKLSELFSVKIANNQLSAKVWYNGKNAEALEQLDITPLEFIKFLHKNKVTYGIIEENVQKILTNKTVDLYPIQIALGKDKQDGKDGDIKYELDLNPSVDRSEGWNFREVMKIPSVKKGEKLATLISPTKGENGKTVSGKIISAKPGKPCLIRAGKNVTFNEEDQSFYATAKGQVNIVQRSINVHTVYEVTEDVSMKTGNIDFIGNVVIRGNVPNGFTVKAAGDIKIFGLVEAATIIADGSVYISEGIAGLKTGNIQAGENVHTGYINQGKVTAGDSLYVENSILHSECTVVNDIVCQKGNIIGGLSSAGKTIRVKNLGNRMHTHTLLSFGTDQKLDDKLASLEEEKAKLTNDLKKLRLLKKRMDQSSSKELTKSKITLLKIKKSFEHTTEKLAEVDKKISLMNVKLGDTENASLHVEGTLFPNVIVSFGKYRRTINKTYNHVSIRMDQNDIVITPY